MACKLFQEIVIAHQNVIIDSNVEYITRVVLIEASMRHTSVENSNLSNNVRIATSLCSDIMLICNYVSSCYRRCATRVTQWKGRDMFIRQQMFGRVFIVVKGCGRYGCT